MDDTRSGRNLNLPKSGRRKERLFIMLCSRCKKRQAVVFIAKTDGQKTENEGLCLICTKELNLKPVSDLMDKMGITDDDLESMEEQLEQFGLGEMGLINIDPNQQDGEGFEPGGAAIFPPFLNSVFGEESKEKRTEEKTDKDKKKEKKRKLLDTYCSNLTKKASEGLLDTIIGRDNEIYRVVQILSRRTKNNPCLIGEPGVGKTAIAEGLALRIAARNVPHKLMDKQIHLLDLTALVAGTQFRGQFESRIKGLVDEVKAEGNIILFIDEVHNLVGTGDAEGSMNAANILKPALSRGEIQVIGATTFTEYRKYIEKDAALERRFQPVTISEPSVNDAIGVLRGIKHYYESHHRVQVSDDIVRNAVVLSERYITDRFLPDKAIDLLDEACACASLRCVNAPEYDNLIRQMDDIRVREEEIEAHAELINYEELGRLRADYIMLSGEADKLRDSVLNNAVTGDDLAKVIELWTGIPASKVREAELKKLSSLEDALRLKVVGQDNAIMLVAAAVRRNRVQISPRRRPASFIFVGPTGVGKTELVKVLAQELFDSPETLIRLDMSEFMEKHSVSRIVGSPPGYVGYDEAGQLTEKVRRKPYSVLLFDEIEKAHPDVLNILLQILDEGRISDAHGRIVNFENTVIVMTSNAGSDKKEGALGFNREANAANREKASKALSEFLRPEFLSRVDEIVVFNQLTMEDFKKISVLILGEYVTGLAEKRIVLSWDDKTIEWICEKAFGKKSAARDLRAVIRREVEDKITTLLVDLADNPPGHIEISADEENLFVTSR